MRNDEQWTRLALAVLKQAEIDYKISIIRLRQSKRYTADNIAKFASGIYDANNGTSLPYGD